jgi:hypothetical protein
MSFPVTASNTPLFIITADEAEHAPGHVAKVGNITHYKSSLGSYAVLEN